jgi:beta-xylosidase
MDIRRVAWLSVFLASVFSTACGGGSSATQNGNVTVTPNLSKLTPTCFAASASNPVMTRGTPATSFQADWNDPSVIKVGNQYVMYATSDNALDFNIGVYRLVSSDGLSWALSQSTPVLQAGAAGSWDARAVETPSVVYFNGQYHMFYTGYPVALTDPYSYKIGHATSADGIS